MVKLQNLISLISASLSEQPFAYALQSKFSKTLRNIYRKTPALESVFNNVPALQACNFIKKELQSGCFSVNIGKCLRTAFFVEHLR